jgi:hypothetical protein
VKYHNGNPSDRFAKALSFLNIPVIGVSLLFSLSLDLIPSVAVEPWPRCNTCVMVARGAAIRICDSMNRSAMNGQVYQQHNQRNDQEQGDGGQPIS